MPESVTEIMDALATQIEDVLCGTANPLIENLQVYGRMHFNPTPPAIDIFPADPFTTPQAFGNQRDLMLVVRARVTTADHEAGQDLLLSMMDPLSDTSVALAVESSDIDNRDLTVDGPSGFGVYNPVMGTGEGLLGCQWTVRVL